MGYKIPVEVSHVLSYNLIFVQKAKTDNAKTFDEMKANREYDNFIKMFEKLQIDALESPIVEDPKNGNLVLHYFYWTPHR